MVRVDDFGAVAGDDRDDHVAVERAIAAAAAKGGGAVVFGPETYDLDAPVVITHDNIVLRGQGMHRTTVIFRHMLNSVTFFRPRPREVVGPDDYLEVHASQGEQAWGATDLPVRLSPSRIIPFIPSELFFSHLYRMGAISRSRATSMPKQGGPAPAAGRTAASVA